jgi:hypothetical protein
MAASPDDDDSALVPLEGTDATVRHTERVNWEWSQSATDWVDLETGLCLTGYEPERTFRQLVESQSYSAPD